MRFEVLEWVDTHHKAARASASEYYQHRSSANENLLTFTILRSEVTLVYPAVITHALITTVTYNFAPSWKRRV